MKVWMRHLVTTVAATGATFATVAGARAETWTLELKRLRSHLQTTSHHSDYATSSQGMHAQFGPEEKSPTQFSEMDEREAAFKRIVKQEPQYKSAQPFRGVAKLGTHEYAFALDTAPPDLKKKETESKAQDSKPQTNSPKTETREDQSDPVIPELNDIPNQTTFPPKAIGYNRLYFDFNHNGRLTDDKVVKAYLNPRIPKSYSARFRFPRIDVKIDVDGKETDYSFYLGGDVYVSRDICHAQVHLNAAAYREGDITLEGKKRRVVLIDFNSNGRFDDEVKMHATQNGPQERIDLEQGDMLLVDPNQINPSYSSSDDPTTSSYRHYVSKLINIDGRYYDLKISPAGDEITLVPSSVPLGSVTNPNDGFCALIYSERGCLKISGNKNTPVPVPGGQWKLVSYTIDQTGYKQPRESLEKQGEAKATSALPSLTEKPENLSDDDNVTVQSLLGTFSTFVSAQATAACKPIMVREGETVEFPFGPPYKPIVMATLKQDEKQIPQAILELSLVGSAGEVCTNMRVNGARPSKPAFAITDSAGNVIEKGNFGLGCCGNGLDYQYFWQVSSESQLFEEHHVRVKMEADPFAIDQENDSVICPGKSQP